MILAKNKVKPTSFHGMTGKYNEDNKLIFKNRNFTSNDYYSNTYIMSLLGSGKYWYGITVGSRGRGKSYSGKNTALKWIKKQLRDIMKAFKNGEVRKFMWWRLSTSAIDAILENNGSSFFEPELLRKHKMVVMINLSDIYFAHEDDYELDGETRKYNWVRVGKVAAIQNYYIYKGNQMNDYDLIIMDELVRAESEKRTFDIPKAFINMIENVCRERKGIKVLIYANTIGEMHEVRDLFDFMPLPGKYGIYKIPHKRAVIEYLDDSEKWKQKKAQTMAGVLSSKMSEFSNVHKDSLNEAADLFVQRKDAVGRRYFLSLKIATGLFLEVFSWKGVYYIDTDSLGAKNNNMRYAIGRELATATVRYSDEIIKLIRELWDNGKLRFSTRMAFQWFREYAHKYSVITLK